jgi:archaellum component FlaC
MQVVEQNVESIKDTAEKRHETIKDYVGRVKEMLEGKVDQVTQFNDKLTAMNDEIQKIKAMVESSMERTLAEVMRGIDVAQKTQDDFDTWRDRL